MAMKWILATSPVSRTAVTSLTIWLFRALRAVLFVFTLFMMLIEDLASFCGRDDLLSPKSFQDWFGGQTSVHGVHSFTDQPLTSFSLRVIPDLTRVSANDLTRVSAYKNGFTIYMAFNKPPTWFLIVIRSSSITFHAIAFSIVVFFTESVARSLSAAKHQ